MNIQMHDVAIALMFVARLLFEHDPTAGQIRKHLIHALGPFADVALEGVAVIHVTESDLKGYLHRGCPRNEMKCVGMTRAQRRARPGCAN